MPRALNLLREEPQFRRQCFTEGLQAAGFEVVDKIAKPEPRDAVLVWNRHGSRDAEAQRFSRVLVAENNYLGIRGWYALARDHHAGCGRWFVGGPERWASLGIELQPWRRGGSEIVILGQRSIGERGIASPRGWEQSIRRQVNGRIRPHPGKRGGGTLEQDLVKARAVVTWASSSALTALTMGIPVFYGLDGWIGAEACLHISQFGQEPKRDDQARERMFCKLAWAMSPVSEIQSGEAIRRLIDK